MDFVVKGAVEIEAHLLPSAKQRKPWFLLVVFAVNADGAVLV